MRQPVELRTGGGRVLIGSLSMIPAPRRGMQSPLAVLARVFHDRDAVAQLRRAWPGLDVGGGHHQQLSPRDMRDVLEQAIALHRIMLLWIPSVSHHSIHVAIPPKPLAAPAPPQGNAPPRPEIKPPPVPVGTMAIPAKVERALVKSFDYIARDGKQGLKAFVAAIDALRKDPVAMAKIVAFCALLAVPVVGEAAAGAFLAYAYYLLGFHGTLAALHFGAACVRAAAATTDAEIDTAAREFADAFEDLGEAVIAWLMARIQPMSSVGARGAAAEKEAAIVAKAETQAAKVVKTGESYQTQVLSKYKEAKEEAVKLAKSKVAEEVAELRQTGAGSAWEAADEAYDAIRASTTDVEAIAKNTGFKAANIQKIKDHVFMNEHILDRYVANGVPARIARFDSDEAIAAAWKRLEQGTHGPADIQLLKHEMAESWYMKNVAPGYDAAHEAAQQRYPAPEF